MKQIFLIAILSVCSLIGLKGQEYYAPIGTTWYYSQGIKCFVTDTFTKNYVHFSKLQFQEEYSDVPSYTALGKDGSNKVYIYDTLRDTSYLFYDLNAQVGDTWNIYYPIDTDIVRFKAFTLGTGLVSPFGKGGKGIKFHINAYEVEYKLQNFYPETAYAFDTLGLFDHLILKTTPSYFPYYRWTPRCIDMPYYGTIKYNWDKACDYSTIGVEEQIYQAKIKVFPNPVTDFLHVELTDFSHAPALKIYDLNGQMVLEPEITESTTDIDVSGLARGMYFIEFKDHSSLLSKQKFIKK